MCVSVLSPVVLSSATITQRYDIPVGMDPVMNPRGHWPLFLTFILFFFFLLLVSRPKESRQHFQVTSVKDCCFYWSELGWLHNTIACASLSLSLCVLCSSSTSGCVSLTPEQGERKKMDAGWRPVQQKENKKGKQLGVKERKRQDKREDCRRVPSHWQFHLVAVTAAACLRDRSIFFFFRPTKERVYVCVYLPPGCIAPAFSTNGSLNEGMGGGSQSWTEEDGNNNPAHIRKDSPSIVQDHIYGRHSWNFSKNKSFSSSSLLDFI